VEANASAAVWEEQAELHLGFDLGQAGVLLAEIPEAAALERTVLRPVAEVLVVALEVRRCSKVLYKEDDSDHHNLLVGMRDHVGFEAFLEDRFQNNNKRIGSQFVDI